MRAAARVGRSSLATTSDEAYGGARVFRWRAGMLAPVAHPAAVDPAGGTGRQAAGGHCCMARSVRAECLGPRASALEFAAMHDALLVAETALLDRHRPLTRDE